MQAFYAIWSQPALNVRSFSALPHNHVRGLQSAVAAHKVDIYVLLEYLREEVSTSFESKQPEDPVVSHFCKAVNYQVCFKSVPLRRLWAFLTSLQSKASGAQVQAYAKTFAATIETKVVADNQVNDYECVSVSMWSTWRLSILTLNTGCVTSPLAHLREQSYQ
jgi:hypothetical protein